MPSLSTPDGRALAWEESGTGSPLLCHPGGPGMSARCFGGLPELAAERTLLLLDPRGTGASERPTDPHDYDLEAYAADVEAVRQHLGLERLDLLGHSHGGFVAMTWASAHPERVGRLILTNTAPRFTDAIRQARMAIASAQAGAPWFDDAAAAVQAHQAGDYADDAELSALLAREAPLLLGGWGEEEQRIAGHLRAGGMNSDALRHFNQHVAPTMDLRAGLQRITSPTLVVTGEADPFGESTGRDIAESLANGTLVVLPGAGHFGYLEPAHREAWAGTILEFLA